MNAALQSTAGSRLKTGKEMPPARAFAPLIAPNTAAPLLFSANNSIMASSPSTSLPTLQNFIQHLVDSLHAEIGVAFRDLETGQEFFYNEKQMMHAASTMKVPVMIEVFRQAGAGRFRLDDSLLIKNAFKSIVDGSPYRLDLDDDSDSTVYRAIGAKMTIRRLVEQMITASSNLATNMLIELVDAKNVMATLRELGAKNMQVRRGVEDAKAYQRGWNNQTDAFDLLLTLQAIAEKRAPQCGAAACDSMLAILQRQKFRDGIPAGLPSGTIAGNKTGWITAITHDGAIVFPKLIAEKQNHHTRKPYLLVVLTKGILEEKSAHRLIAEISRKVYSGLMASL